MYDFDDWCDDSGDNRAVMSIFFILAISAFLIALDYPTIYFDSAVYEAAKHGSKGTFVIALIINIVDLLVSVLGWYCGAKMKLIWYCIIWFGFLSMKAILDTADLILVLKGYTSFDEKAGAYVLRFADIVFQIYSAIVVIAFLTELVRQQREEHSHGDGTAAVEDQAQPRSSLYKATDAGDYYSAEQPDYPSKPLLQASTSTPLAAASSKFSTV
ncbi:hypothetical protein Ocin01_16907 [Orchesella cincta]|uniref:Uncharacterized protein n=1 Tax=Orchesella cincta TaxID=48709 RepID=A0A1D2M9W4_ORCCI|nr:hypothetical protein Ocin01_16907 [Orchesella cincta]